MRSSIVFRIQRFHSLGAPFSAADLAHIESTIVHINPLFYGEFPDELIPKVKELNPSVKFLVADAQGFIRYGVHTTVGRRFDLVHGIVVMRCKTH